MSSAFAFGTFLSIHVWKPSKDFSSDLVNDRLAEPYSKMVLTAALKNLILTTVFQAGSVLAMLAPFESEHLYLAQYKNLGIQNLVPLTQLMPIPLYALQLLLVVRRQH